MVAPAGRAGPTPPDARDPSAGPVNPIDALRPRRSSKPTGLAPSPEADRRTLIRRLTLRPDRPAADARGGRRVRCDDPAPTPTSGWSTACSPRPQYGVRWARLWLDLARFGESNGFEYDEFRPNAWRYRDWVVDALNRDLPYDEFARLQLAGDVLRPDDPSAVEATGFLVAGAYDTVGQNQQSEAMRKVVRQDELEDLVGTVGQTFLGLTVHCARCHDHKFDPIRQAEYYRLASALGGRPPRRARPLGDRPGLSAASRRIDGAGRAGRRDRGPGAGAVRAGGGPAAGGPRRPSPPGTSTAAPTTASARSTATLQGGATLTPDGLRLDGKTGYAADARR